MSELEQKAISDISKAIALALKSSEDEWEKATSPMKTDITSKKESLDKLVTTSQKTIIQKKLEGFKTFTLLDNLYLNSDKTPINGIPMVGQVIIVGLPSSGKSILIEEIAVSVANSGKKVLLVSSEDSYRSPTPRFDLEQRLKQKADILGLSWEKISHNLFVLDTVINSELRNWSTFAEVYRHVCETKQIDLVLIDSITLLETTYRGALKHRIQELSRYNQVHGLTTIYVSQRSKEAWDVREYAGSIGLGHVADSTIIVDYGRTYHSLINRDLNTKRGTDVRIVRVLGCRMCAYDGTYKRVTISSDGFLRLYQEPQQP